MTSIVEYSETEAALTDLSARYQGVIFQVATREGMRDAKKSRGELRDYRIALENKRKEIKAPALKRSQEIDSEARRITAMLEALEKPIAQQIEFEEGKAERTRLAAIQAEQDRIATEERAKKEAEEKVMAAQRAEIARQQEELAKAQREAAAKIEADQRAARLKIEEEERASRLAREQADREARLEQQARDEVARQKREAEEARLKAERDKIEADSRAIADAKRKEQEAEEAVQREIRRKEAESLDGRALLNDFTHRFGALPEFAEITKVIYDFLEQA